jgi:hypothetical protein
MPSFDIPDDGFPLIIPFDDIGMDPERRKRGYQSDSPAQASGIDQMLVMQIVNALSSRDANPRQIAADLARANPETQINFARIVFSLINHWSQMGQYMTDPDNPLRGVYAVSREITNSVGVRPNG